MAKCAPNYSKLALHGIPKGGRRSKEYSKAKASDD